LNLTWLSIRRACCVVLLCSDRLRSRRVLC